MNRSQIWPIVSHRALYDLAFALRKCALSLENAISIGLRSGEYLGRNSIHGPIDHHGAVRPSCLSAAIKVCVCHLPKGASAFNRYPRRLRPRSDVMLVFTGCLINEHQAMGVTLHGRLMPTAPFGPYLSCISAFLFRCQQCFFYN